MVELLKIVVFGIGRSQLTTSCISPTSHVHVVSGNSKLLGNLLNIHIYIYIWVFISDWGWIYASERNHSINGAKMFGTSWSLILSIRVLKNSEALVNKCILGVQVISNS